MLGNKKGNVVIAAVIIAAALCVCTAGMLYGLKKFQNNMISYAEAQKADIVTKLTAQKYDIVSRLRDQKNEAKKFVWNREARMRDFVRKELKSAKLELDNTK